MNKKERSTFVEEFLLPLPFGEEEKISETRSTAVRSGLTHLAMMFLNDVSEMTVCASYALRRS